MSFVKHRDRTILRGWAADLVAGFILAAEIIGAVEIGRAIVQLVAWLWGLVG